MPNKPHLLRIGIQKRHPMNVFIWSSDPSVGKKYLIPRSERWQGLVSVSELCCLFVINKYPRPGLHYWRDRLVSPPSDDWLFIFSWMFGLKPSQFLFRARNLTENFPAWSTRLSERWEGWGRGRLDVQDTWQCSVSVRRCHWRMFAFNISPLLSTTQARI